MSFSAGDVLCIPFFPHEEDPQEGEKRFIIIIENLGDEVLVVPMTKNLEKQQYQKNSFVIKKNNIIGYSMGLLFDSLIMPCRHKLIKISQIKFCRVFGETPSEYIDYINEKIKSCI